MKCRRTTQELGCSSAITDPLHGARASASSSDLLVGYFVTLAFGKVSQSACLDRVEGETGRFVFAGKKSEPARHEAASLDSTARPRSHR